MNSSLIFTNLRRFNTLLPATSIGLLVLTLSWAYFNDRRAADPISSVETPNSANELHELDIRATDIDAGNTLVMKIVAPSSAKGSYELKPVETVNLVFLKGDADKANWLFPDQSRVITTLQALSDGKKTMALYLETKPRQKTGQDSKRIDAEPIEIHLVSVDGLRHLKVLSGVKRVLRHRTQDQLLQLVYQQGLTVKSMRVSLPDFEIQSEGVVVNLTNKS